MSDKIIDGIVLTLVAIASVALIAAVLSKNSNTSSVLSTGGTQVANAIKTALSPLFASAQGTASSSISYDLGS